MYFFYVLAYFLLFVIKYIASIYIAPIALFNSQLRPLAAWQPIKQRAVSIPPRLLPHIDDTRW